MKSIKNLEHLQRQHLLIENERTGSPKELAQRMHVSERLEYIIERLKEDNASVCYNGRRKTYHILRKVSN